MRTESKRPPVLPQRTQATEKTAPQQKTAAAGAPAQTAAAPAEFFATGFDAAPARRNVADPMPNAPLTDEQMTRAVDEALNLAVGGNVPAAQRNAWLEEGRKLKAEGKTANEIKWTLFNKINEAKEKSELARPGAMERVVDEALELAGATNNPDLRRTAQDMAKQLKEAGKSASEIKWTVFNALTAAKDQKSLDGAGLEKAVDDAMELAGVNKNSPSRAAWIAEAKKMIEERQKLIDEAKAKQAAGEQVEVPSPLGANDIKWKLFNKIEEAKGQKALDGAGLQKVVDEALDMAGAKNNPDLRKTAKEMAEQMKADGKTANEIKWTVFNALTAAQGKKALDGEGLNQAVRTAMEMAGLDPKGPKFAEWLKEAQTLIAENNKKEGATPLGANDIKFALFNKREAAKDAKLLTDEGLGKLLDEASELALNKKLSASARDAWLVEAKKLRDEGKTAVEIKWKLFNMLYP